jgi:hypothetical protein
MHDHNFKNLILDYPVQRLNLPNMAYSPEDRLEMYWAAQTGVNRLEDSLEKQRKYADFIDFYADLSEDEVVCYRMRYFSEKGENFMGFMNVLREEGRQEGIHQTLIEYLGVFLDIKFGFEGLTILPQLMAVKDIQQLKQLIQVIKLAKTPNDVLSILDNKPIVV